MRDLALEVELDLGLLLQDIESLAHYMDRGMSEGEAARQVAQDLLGSMGAMVQGASLVRE